MPTPNGRLSWEQPQGFPNPSQQQPFRWGQPKGSPHHQIQQSQRLFVHGKQTKPSYGNPNQFRIDRRRPNRPPPSRHVYSAPVPTISCTPTANPPMTSAISLAHPTEHDKRMSSELEADLAVRDPLATPQDVEARKDILKKLNALLDEWAAAQSERMSWSPEDAAKIRIGLRPFGSYCLGAYGSKSDMDTVAMFPCHIDRSHFFDFFPDVLRKWDEVKELIVIKDAFVPLMKMCIRGIDVDLLFARLDMKVVPQDLDLSNDSIIQHLPDLCVRSLNGCRLSNALIKHVPNMDEFRTALRAIKLWAKRQGVYGNKLGYLGGVSWAILMARVAQLYPNANASILVRKFFLVWAQWEWPRPVLINPIQNIFSLKVWDPRIHEEDRFHLMPIITPVYPAHNTTYNVSAATLPVIVAAIQRGKEMTESIAKGEATWADLFSHYPFFNDFKHFVTLETTAETAGDLATWSGLVEARTRKLVGVLLENEATESVTIWPNAVSTDTTKTWWIGFNARKAGEGEGVVNLNLTAEFKRFSEIVRKYASKFWRTGMEIDVKYVRKSELKTRLPSSLLQNKKKRSRASSGISVIGAPTPKRLKKGSVSPLLSAGDRRASDSSSGVFSITTIIST